MKKTLKLPGRNGDHFDCEVKSTKQGSIICLVNQTTHDKWFCHVTSKNIDLFRSKMNNDLQLRGQDLVIMAILQAVLKGDLGPMASTYVLDQDWCTLHLKQKFSTYFMKLQLKCQIGGTKGCWCFPMNPEDPRPIYLREIGEPMNGTP